MSQTQTQVIPESESIKSLAVEGRAKLYPTVIVDHEGLNYVEAYYVSINYHPPKPVVINELSSDSYIDTLLKTQQPLVFLVDPSDEVSNSGSHKVFSNLPRVGEEPVIAELSNIVKYNLVAISNVINDEVSLKAFINRLSNVGDYYILWVVREYVPHRLMTLKYGFPSTPDYLRVQLPSELKPVKKGVGYEVFEAEVRGDTELTWRRSKVKAYDTVIEGRMQYSFIPGNLLNIKGTLHIVKSCSELTVNGDELPAGTYAIHSWREVKE